MLTLSPQGQQFLKNFESCRLHCYKDISGYWTIGWGKKLSPAEYQEYKNIGITQVKADAMFLDSVNSICKDLGLLPLHGFTQNQQDAIICLAYNIGVNYFSTETTVYRHLRDRNGDLSPWLWLKNANGKPSDALLRRRTLELKLFVYNDYTMT